MVISLSLFPSKCFFIFLYTPKGTVTEAAWSGRSTKSGLSVSGSRYVIVVVNPRWKMMEPGACLSRETPDVSRFVGKRSFMTEATAFAADNSESAPVTLEVSRFLNKRQPFWVSLLVRVGRWERKIGRKSRRFCKLRNCFFKSPSRISLSAKSANGSKQIRDKCLFSGFRRYF